MSLSATTVVDATSKAVRFTITGATAANRLTLDAFPQGGPSYRVRTMYTAQPGGDVAALDGDAPFGVPVSYVVTDTATGGQYTVPAVTVDSDAPILADALNPLSAAAVVVKSQPPNVWVARSVWWDILGSRAPFVSIAPLRYRNGDLVLWVADTDARNAVLGILAGGSPFALRTPCRDAVDDVIGLPVSVREDLVLESDPDGARLFTITYQAVARELGPYAGEAGRTYAVALSEAADYGAQSAMYATYVGLLSGVPR